MDSHKQAPQSHLPTFKAMLHLFYFLSTTSTLVILLTTINAKPIESPSPPNKYYTLRPLHHSDLNSVSKIIVSAFDPGVLWTYLYEFRDEYPEYHLRCFRESVEGYWQTRGNDSYAMGIVPREEGEHEDGAKGDVISVAWWSLINNTGQHSIQTSTSGLFHAFGPLPSLDTKQHTINPNFNRLQNPIHNQQGRPLDCNLHLDMNSTRAVHLAPQLAAAEAEFIANAPYKHQFYLGILATRPDWDGNGFGAALVEWGIEWARQEEARLNSEIENRDGERVKVPVTLLATPIGYQLYKSLGFESLKNVTFDLLDDFSGGTTWYEYMRYFNKD